MNEKIKPNINPQLHFSVRNKHKTILPDCSRLSTQIYRGRFLLNNFIQYLFQKVMSDLHPNLNLKCHGIVGMNIDLHNGLNLLYEIPQNMLHTEDHWIWIQQTCTQKVIRIKSL